jgi:HSP20 family molecular chaperone IbpA
MSALSLLNEFRPLFRMLEEPLHRSPAYFAPLARQAAIPRFGGLAGFNGPAVQLSDEGSAFTVEAELPGVRREDLNVSIGENGRRLTIRGSRATRSSQAPSHEAPANADAAATTEPASGMSARSPVQSSSLIFSVDAASSSVPTTAKSTDVSAPTPVTPTAPTPESSFTFSRTLWLPEVVDAAKVTAQLKDGMLTLTIPKAEAAQVDVVVM